MSDKKQTAVEWAFDQITNIDWKHLSDSDRNDLFEQAKQIEREQIIESYYAGTAQFANEAPIVNHKTPEDYYNETYGN